jgi:hypothetical protein
LLPEAIVTGRGQLCDLATFLGDLFVAFLRRVRFSCLEESLQMGLDGPPRGQGAHRGVRLDLGRVEEQLLSPYQPGIHAHLHYPLEEAPEDL